MPRKSSGLNVDILGALMPSLGEEYRLGVRGLLGRFLDRASHGRIQTLTGSTGLDALRVAARSAAAAVEVSRQRDLDSLRQPNDDVRIGALNVFDRPLDPDAVPNALSELDLEAVSGALSILLADPVGDPPVVHILFCPTRPSMGPLAPCSIEDLKTTWIRLAGGDSNEGRYLLEEPVAELGRDQELLLTERMRKLYGG